jgi:prepilin peptidase CpaA
METLMPAIVQMLPLLIFPALVIVGALKDVTGYTIPNWISLSLILAFPVAALASGVSPGAFGLNVAVGVAALAAGMVMFALRWIGGGDAKLFAAAALWLGLPAMFTYLFVLCLAGGALAVGLLALRSGWVRPFVVTGPAWFARLAEPEEAVPYGLAIAVGALVAFPLSPLLKGVGLPL